MTAARSSVCLIFGILGLAAALRAQQAFRPPAGAIMEKRSGRDFCSGKLYLTAHGDTALLVPLGFREFRFAGRSVRSVKYTAVWPADADFDALPPQLTGLVYDAIPESDDVIFIYERAAPDGKSAPDRAVLVGSPATLNNLDAMDYWEQRGYKLVERRRDVNWNSDSPGGSGWIPFGIDPISLTTRGVHFPSTIEVFPRAGQKPRTDNSEFTGMFPAEPRHAASYYRPRAAIMPERTAAEKTRAIPHSTLQLRGIITQERGAGFGGTAIYYGR